MSIDIIIGLSLSSSRSTIIQIEICNIEHLPFRHSPHQLGFEINETPLPPMKNDDFMGSKSVKRLEMHCFISELRNGSLLQKFFVHPISMQFFAK